MQIAQRAKKRWNNLADGANQWDALDWEEKTKLIFAEKTEPGDELYFIKSGNKVKVVSSNTTESDSVNDAWLVARIDGQSKGKQMKCNACSLKAFLPGGGEDFFWDFDS